MYFVTEENPSSKTQPNPHIAYDVAPTDRIGSGVPSLRRADSGLGQTCVYRIFMVKISRKQLLHVKLNLSSARGVTATSHC